MLKMNFRCLLSLNDISSVAFFFFNSKGSKQGNFCSLKFSMNLVHIYHLGNMSVNAVSEPFLSLFSVWTDS